MGKNRILPYHPDLKERARELRKNATLAEKRLWHELRRRQLGYEFHRQVPIGYFIADFFCHELSLAIEADGASYESETAKENDARRQQKLETFDISFLRFTDDEILGNLDKVIARIQAWIAEFEA